MPLIRMSRLCQLLSTQGWTCIDLPHDKFRLRNRYGRNFQVAEWLRPDKRIRIEPTADRLPYADN
jgi:hypothetical protein